MRMIKPEDTTKQLCKEENCARTVRVRSMCRAHYEKQLKLENPKYAESQRLNCVEWHKKNRHRVRIRDIKRREDPILRARDAITKRRSRLKKFGLTIENYNELLKQQNGACAICEKPPNSVVLDVDHDHKTGKVRGLLCRGCNTLLGHIEKRTDTWIRATTYLAIQKHPWLKEPIPQNIIDELNLCGF